MRKKQENKPTGAPVFIYTSECCKVPATKAPCVALDKKAAETQSLGSWRCGQCKKTCKVYRTKNVDRKEVI